MKNLIILLLISFSTKAQFIPVIGSINYDRKIRKIEPKKVIQNGVSSFNGFNIIFNGEENESTGELREILETLPNGQTINIIKEPLGIMTGQAFYISANTTNVILKYTTVQSLENAIYTYLDLLGVNWYGAGSNWYVKKPVLNIPIIAGNWIEPTFRSRTFDGTGGLDYGLSFDPNFLYKKNWYAFKRRNKYNKDFSVPAHSGQAFYIANKTLSDNHPEWFYNESGKINGRIRVEIPAAIQAYADWFKRFPNLRDSFITINADPEDGRGNGPEDPLPPDGFQGLNNWNASEKWWYFANEISKQYDSNNTRIKIASLSYGDGPTVTLVPRFPLKKNVYPMITPYAFQTAYLPSQMVKTWNAAIPGNMGMYDYWNITQWSLGLPGFNMYNIPKLLSFWRKNTVDAIQLETTDAGGPMGHIFWIAGQMQFDTTKNFDTLYKKYLVNCFGKGWKPLKNMFDRWSLNYQYNQDVNFSLRDLKNACDSVSISSQEYKRITDLKAYVHFMFMMAKRNQFSQPSNDSVYQYIYSIHQRMMIQTAAFVGQRYFGPAPAAITNHQLTDEEVQQNFISDLAQSPVQYNISQLVFDYNKVTYLDTITGRGWWRGVYATGIFMAPITGNISVDVGTKFTTRFKVFTEDTVLINKFLNYDSAFDYSEFIFNDTWHMKNYTFPVTKGTIYYLATTEAGLGRVKMKSNNITMFFPNQGNDFDNSDYPIKYFYVPLGTTKIAYLDGYEQPTNGRGYLIPPGGTPQIRTATTAKDIYTVNVQPGQDGKVWRADFGHSSFSLVNIPNYSSLQNFSYTE